MSGLAINGDVVHGFAIKGQAFPSVQISDGEIKVGGKTYDLDTTKYFVPNDGNITIHESSTTFSLIAGKKYPIYSDLTDEWGSRHLGIYVEDNINQSYGRYVGEIVEITGDHINDGKIIGGVISPLTHIVQGLRSLLKEVITWA